MKIDFTGLTTDAQWWEFEFKPEDGSEPEVCQLQIEPYPAEKATVTMTSDGALIMKGRDQKEVFMTCLKAWKGAVDANGNDLLLTEKVKEAIFTYRPDNAKFAAMVTFVLEKSRVMRRQEADLEKK